MAQYHFRGESRSSNYMKTDKRGRKYVDYRSADELRRFRSGS